MTIARGPGLIRHHHRALSAASLSYRATGEPGAETDAWFAAKWRGLDALLRALVGAADRTAAFGTLAVYLGGVLPVQW